MSRGGSAGAPSQRGLVRRILLGVGALLAGNAASTVTAMASSLILARHLGAADYGRYSLVFLYASFFQGLASFGVDDVLTRELSRRAPAAERLLGNAVLLRLGLSGIAVVSCVLVAHWGEVDRRVAGATVVAVLPLLLSALYVPLWSWLAARMEYPLRESIVVASRVAELALLAGFAVGGAGFPTLVAVTAAAQGLPLVLTLWLLRGRVRVRVRYDRETARQLLSQAAPLGLASVVALVYGRVDGVLLARLAGYEAVGLYSAAYKFLNLALTLPYVVNAAVFPVLARVEEERATVQVVFQRTFDYLTLVALPLAVGTTVLAPWVVRVVYSEGYVGAADSLRVLLWAAVFMFAARTCRQVLVAGGQQATHLLLLVGGALANVLLNLWWIPRWGILGAAWATLCAEVFVLAAGYWAVRERLGLGLQWGFALRALVATAGMAAATAVSVPLGSGSAVAVGGCAYLLATALLGLWPREPRALLREVGARVGAW